MATATKKVPPVSPPPKRSQERVASPSLFDRFARALDVIYRFLASLKLAVFSLGALVATLAYATFFESWYGGGASQEWIYRSTGFAILLAFLGMNILCAALIRFPWKKRQTGFVITHVGLLTLLGGSYSCVRTADEGQVGMLEGDVKSELVRTNHPVIRVREVDPQTLKPMSEFDLPFRPGSFAWGAGTPQPKGVADRALGFVSLGLLGFADSYEDVLTSPGSPFRFVVKEFLPASAPAKAHVADVDGAPMARLELQFKGPGMPRAQDAFRSEKDHWFATDKRFFRVVRSQPPALIAFSHVDRPELVEDFLKPPSGSGASGVARFRYQDKSGRVRTFDWALDGQQGKSVVLPESSLSVTLSEATEFPTSTGRLDQILGDDPIPIAVFKIQSGKDEPVTHMALANLPMVPNVIPPTDASGRAPPRPLAAIHYMVTPTIDPDTNGRRGQIEILAGPDESLHYRVFGQGKESKGELRSAGHLEKGKPIVAFGGGANMKMTISFQLDQYLPSAIEKQIYEPVVLPKGKMDEGIAACRAEMTVGNQTKEVWLARSLSLDPPAPRFVSFPEATYEVKFDVDRKPLDFELKLDDFEVGFEPGTEQATKFVSQVELSDPSQGIKNQPHTISMNHPLYHRGYTFYQSRYMPEIDPHTDQTTGRFESVFQVAINPARPVIYAGCLMVVLGAFVQFYMRAGIFTDGGKRERERATAKQRKRLAKAQDKPPSAPGDEPL
ncbi:MAG: cytochrome c biogenesis protein ResB [Isosphaerales bacterium]